MLSEISLVSAGEEKTVLDYGQRCITRKYSNTGTGQGEKCRLLGDSLFEETRATTMPGNLGIQSDQDESASKATYLVNSPPSPVIQ